MNIFVLDKDPILAAKFACDKHVVKMVTESCQMLCTTHNILDGIKKENNISKDGKPIILYKTAYENHPCSIWVRKTSSNYKWLYEHALALCHEYTKRYGKIHRCQYLIDNFLFNLPKNIKDGELTEFAQAMPEEYKNKDVVQAYRQYYIGEKLRFAKWKNGEPQWLKNLQ